MNKKSLLRLNDAVLVFFLFDMYKNVWVYKEKCGVMHSGKCTKVGKGGGYTKGRLSNY